MLVTFTLRKTPILHFTWKKSVTLLINLHWMMVNANKYNNNDDYNYSCINIVSELLGVDPNTLQKVITRSSVMAHGNNDIFLFIY